MHSGRVAGRRIRDGAYRRSYSYNATCRTIVVLVRDRFRNRHHHFRIVESFLAESEKPAAAAKEVTSRVRMVTREDDKNAFFETQDRQQKDGWIHRNYIKKQ